MISEPPPSDRASMLDVVAVSPLMLRIGPREPSSCASSVAFRVLFFPFVDDGPGPAALFWPNSFGLGAEPATGVCDSGVAAVVAPGGFLGSGGARPPLDAPLMQGLVVWENKVQLPTPDLTKPRGR